MEFTLHGAQEKDWTQWQQVYAWLPVRVTLSEIVWLQTVEVRQHSEDSKSITWERRLPGAREGVLVTEYDPEYEKGATCIATCYE